MASKRTVTVATYMHVCVNGPVSTEGPLLADDARCARCYFPFGAPDWTREVPADN